jgi:hypothetical protein
MSGRSAAPSDKDYSQPYYADQTPRVDKGREVSLHHKGELVHAHTTVAYSSKYIPGLALLSSLHDTLPTTRLPIISSTTTTRRRLLLESLFVDVCSYVLPPK